MSNALSILWFQLDLRLADNPALQAARNHGTRIVPVFIWSPAEESPWEPGSASRWWLHQSLRALDESLRQLGSRLIIRRGPALEALLALIRETGAGVVFWNRRSEPAMLGRNQKILAALREAGVAAETFNGALLREPCEVTNKACKPFQVFTPFWKHCLAMPEPAEPIAAPKSLAAPSQWPKSNPLAELELEPRIDWAGGLRAAWCPSEVGAVRRLNEFVSQTFTDYSQLRNRPDLAGTSQLSPHLHFGEISPRQVWHQVRKFAERRHLPCAVWRHSQFLTELGWREFAHHLLFHFPKTPEEPLRPAFQKFPWRDQPSWLRAWQKGKTGFPIVDAGMRELWTTGWMHNRVRMVVASFLIKDCLVDWREGARWFWDTLVDADLAQNTLGWQWTAGCGADAAPYFRIFNPTAQGEKFDPEGNYVRRWCPELAKMPAKWIHRPNEAPLEILRLARVEPGATYPKPILSHTIAREVALEAFAKTKAGI